MSFSAAVKAKTATTRYALVRIEPGRYLALADLTALGSDTYTVTMPDGAYVSRVLHGDVNFEREDSLTGDFNEFVFDESTRLLTIRTDGPYNDADYPVVVYYYLFFTGGETAHYEDPTDDATAARAWSPRLATSPKVTEGFRNITSGVFTFEETDFSITNVDHFFEEYLGPNDSFYQKDVTVWFVVDGEIERLYTGKVSAVSIDQDSVSFKCFDVFSRLGQPLLMGDSRDKAFYFRNSASYPSLDPSKSGRPCPYVFGSSSPAAIGGTLTFLGTTLYYLQLDFTEEATNIAWEPSQPDVLEAQDDANRTWALCRVSSDGMKTLDFGTMSNFSNSLGGMAIQSYRSARDDNLEIGDIFKHTKSTGGDFYWLVNRIVDNPGGGYRTIYVEPLRCPVFNSDPTFFVTGFDSAGTYYTNDAPCVWVDGRRMIPELDFTWSTETLSSGNLVVKVEFETASTTLEAIDVGAVGVSAPYGWRTISTDVYERSFPGTVDFIDIDNVYRSGTTMRKSTNLSANDEWYYDRERRRLRIRVAATPVGGGPFTADMRWHRVRSDSDVRYVVRTADSNLNHADAVQLIAETCGLDSIDSVSFAAAKAALSANVRFTIPFRGATAVLTGREYLAEILKSTAGFLRINADREVEYQLLTAAPAPSVSRDDSVTLKESVSVSIDYEDVATRIVATNDHISGLDTDDDPAGVSSAESRRARFLHGITREVAMTHVLDDISDRIDVHMALRAERTAVYRLATTTTDLDTLPGDDVELESRVALGGEEAADLKAIRVAKSIERVEIQATDLLGL